MSFPVSSGTAIKSWTWVSYIASTGLNSPEPRGTCLLTNQLYDIQSLADGSKTVHWNRQKVSLCPSPKQGPLISPCLKGRGFTLDMITLQSTTLSLFLPSRRVPLMIPYCKRNNPSTAKRRKVAFSSQERCITMPDRPSSRRNPEGDSYPSVLSHLHLLTVI